MSRHFYNFLISIHVVAFLVLPFATFNQTGGNQPPEKFIGDNSFHCLLNNGTIGPDTLVNAELVRSHGSFYLNRWPGVGRENRITFDLNDEELHTGTMRWMILQIGISRSDISNWTMDSPPMNIMMAFSSFTTYSEKD
jgi:hypothetical protein